MHELKKIKPLYKIALLVLVLFAVVIALPGCAATRGAVARGWAGGVVADDVIYTASMEGNLVAINTTDWRTLQSIPFETQEPASGFLSCAQGSSAVAIYGSPVIADDLVFVGGYNGKVYAFSRTEMRQEPRWIYPRQDNVGGSIIGGIIYNQGTLYFGSANNKVFALDAADVDSLRGYTLDIAFDEEALAVVDASAGSLFSDYSPPYGLYWSLVVDAGLLSIECLIIPAEGTPSVKVIASETVEIATAPIVPSKGVLPRTVDPASVPFEFGPVYSGESIFPDSDIELDQPYINEINRRYGQLAIVLRAQTLWDVDCWTKVLGEPLKPGDIHEAIRQKMPEGGAS